MYVGDGIAEDFYVEMADFVDDETADLIRSVFKDRGQADFVVTTVREAIAEEPRVAGRLALWGRRLVGEALSQAQRVAAERDSLTELLVSGEGGLDLAGVGELADLTGDVALTVRLWTAVGWCLQLSLVLRYGRAVMRRRGWQ